MPRRRSRLRVLFDLLMVVGLAIAIGAGALALRDHLLVDDPVLTTDPAADPDPPRAADAAAFERVPPLSIRFEGVGVDDPIRPVGLDEDGELEVPDETEVGWWELGSAPGLPGATVLAAHVSWNGSNGPFQRLGQAEIGARLEVDTGDGFVRVYQVIERTMYEKDELPAERIWRTSGNEMLVLITCGGDFNPQIRRYRHNIVVYAIPVAQRRADEVSTTTQPDDVSAAGLVPGPASSVVVD